MKNNPGIIRFSAIVLGWMLLSGCGSKQRSSSISAIIPPDEPSSARAHAHNDYRHDTPLVDALSHGFTSVEVDIHEIGGELFVAHGLFGIRPSRTLTDMYLDPLYGLFHDRNGTIRPNGEPLILLIDIKSEATSSFDALHETLRSYADMLTIFGPDGIRYGAVSIVISGNRNANLIRNARPRLTAMDGRLVDLGRSDSLLIPLVSDNWSSHFQWNGNGPMPIEQYARLKETVSTAHASGRGIRFWATPDKPGHARTAVWDTLRSVGVDLISTDDLVGLDDYLHER